MRIPVDPNPKLTNTIFAFGRGAPDLQIKLDCVEKLRQAPGSGRLLDQQFLEQLALQYQALQECQASVRKYAEMIQKLSADPLFPATFLEPVTVGAGNTLHALVQHGNAERIVGLASGVDLASLQLGDEVYLGRELNVIMGRAPSRRARGRETCTFERKTSDERLVVKSRDEELILQAPASLLEAELKTGDLLSCDRSAMIAFEKIERSQGKQFFLEEAPTVTFAQIGGLTPQIKDIKDTLLMNWNHEDTTRKYQTVPKGSILLHGPAGVGKTMLAKALANYVAEIVFGTPGKCLFMNIKPGALHSMWYSQSEANYRELFRVAREAASRDKGIPLVMFFDEVDSIGGARGQSYMRVHDNVLTAFIAELDGLEARGNILVIGATNRPEAVDPALVRPGRLGDLVLEVPRPNQKAARDILGKHLAPDIPYAQNGHGPNLSATRLEIIENAVSQIYAPNAEQDLANLTFRDGKRRVVRAPDLVSGAVLANIARRAVEKACLREIETGREDGVTWEDVSSAITREFETAARVLTPGNCRLHLSGLPHDSDVVSVELVTKKVSRPQRFLNAA